MITWGCLIYVSYHCLILMLTWLLIVLCTWQTNVSRFLVSGGNNKMNEDRVDSLIRVS